MKVNKFGNIIFHAIPMARKKFLLTDDRISVQLLCLSFGRQILFRIQIQVVIICVTHWWTRTCSLLEKGVATSHLWAGEPAIIFSSRDTACSVGLYFVESSLVGFVAITVASRNIAPVSRSELASCREIPALKKHSFIVAV